MLIDLELASDSLEIEFEEVVLAVAAGVANEDGSNEKFEKASYLVETCAAVIRRYTSWYALSEPSALSENSRNGASAQA